MRNIIIIWGVFLATGNYSFSQTVIVNTIVDKDLIVVGDSLLKTGEFKKAIDAFSIVIELSPQKQYPWAQRGYAYLNLDNYDAALCDLNEAINLKSNDYISLCNRALTKLYLGKYDECIKDCKAALEIKPDYSYAFFYHGCALVSLENYKEAIEYFDRTIDMDSTFQRAYINRGVAKLNIGDNDGACTDFSKAKELGYINALKAIEQYCIKK